MNSVVIVSGEQQRDTAISTRIHSPPNSPPIQAATEHWAEFRLLCSRSLLFNPFKYNSVYISIPNSLILPSPNLSYPSNHNLVFEVWVCFCFVCEFICIIPFYFLKYVFIWLHWLLVLACGFFGLGMQTLFFFFSQTLNCGIWDLGPPPGIKPRTPCIGSAES